MKKSSTDKRIERLKKLIQVNYDSFNWRGYDEKEDRATNSAQIELVKLTGEKFQPVYNCPP